MIEITRLEQTERGTLGQILVDGKVVCYSLELPWKDNEQNVSCIPTGAEYRCDLEYSNRYGVDLWEVKNVEGRSEIKFHKGNYLKDSRGCILVGTEPSYDEDGNRCVLQSSKAFNKFMSALNGRVGDMLTVRRV